MRSFTGSPTRPKRAKRGRPKKYGKRLEVHRLRYKPLDIDGKRYAMASVVVQTKMCPTPVRLVVIRTRPPKTKAFQYFCVFTTDLTLDVCQIVRYYRQRWWIETAFRDVKQNFGFDAYRVKTHKSINRLVQLSFVASCITQWLFSTPNAKDGAITVEQVCRALGIDWYRPTKLTRGLMAKYLAALMEARLFSQTTDEETKTPNIQQTLDRAA